MAVTNDVIVRELGGEKVLSQGKETIYKVSVFQLIKFLTPFTSFYVPYQRPVDGERVSRLRKIQEKEYAVTRHYSITTTMIVLGQCPKLSNKHNKYGFGVIDGQHRLAVLEELIDPKFGDPTSLVGEMTLIKVFKTDDATELRKYFVAINDNWEPVPRYNLDDVVKEVVDGVVKWFRHEFHASMFSELPRCLRPHIYHDGQKGLPNELSSSKSLVAMVEECGGETKPVIKRITTVFMNYNKHLSGLSTPSFFVKKGDEATRKFLDKARDNGLLLGMKVGFVWIEEAFEFDGSDQ